MSTEPIHTVPLFASLPHEALHHLENMVEKEELQVEQILFRVGDAGDSLHSNLNGFGEIIKFIGSPGARLIAVRTKGNFIGETALCLVVAKAFPGFSPRQVLDQIKWYAITSG